MVEKKVNLLLHKISILCVKYFPIIFGLIIFIRLLTENAYIGIGLGIFGYPSIATIILLYLLSYIFKFC